MLLHDFFNYNVRVRGSNIFAVQEQRTLTYAEAGVEVNRMANALLSAGLKAGDRFAYLSKNSIDQVIAYLAASKTGIVPVPLNYRLVPSEWSYIINDAGAKLLIAQKAYVAGIDTIRGELITVGGCYVLDGTANGWKDYRTWVDGQSSEEPDADIDDEHVLYQMYTSGTTGYPKGALLTHRCVITNAFQSNIAMEKRVEPGDRFLVIMPLFHAGATSFVFAAAMGGATMEIHTDFDADKMVDALASNITVANLVPAMIQACLVSVADVAERDYSNLKAIIYGASAIAEDTLRKALSVFKCDVYQGFGQTESSAVLTFMGPEEHRRALHERPELLRSAGRAVAATELRIADAEGNTLPAGEVGEILAKGPQVMQGYWNMPEESSETIVDGWLHTGDVGLLDEEGYLYIKDRVKDMVISGGENIYPREIENVLMDHPFIEDVAVIGVPDEKFGEAVMAIVVLANGAQLGVDELIDYSRSRLAGYKIPRRVEFVCELPRNPSGKVLKKDLRRPYWITEKC